MTITVTITGLDLTPIVWRAESLWLPSALYIHHVIKGATKGPYYAQGQDNAVATLQGRCPRNPANENLLRSMIGAYCTVQGRGTHNARITSISDNNPDNPAWVYFTVSVMEV